MTEEILTNESEPIDIMFELSHAEYLVIPRTVLQSMPVEWQKRFVACIEEMDILIDWRQEFQTYWVELRMGYEKDGAKMVDPLADYQRGRRKLPLKDVKL
jgi:hypothetical protein